MRHIVLAAIADGAVTPDERDAIGAVPRSADVSLGPVERRAIKTGETLQMIKLLAHTGEITPTVDARLRAIAAGRAAMDDWHEKEVAARAVSHT